MKRKKYTAKLLSMAVAANLIFSSFAMPVVSAETGTVGAEAVREAGMADGSDGNAAAGKESAKEMETSANETVTEAATEAAVPSGETSTEAAVPSGETLTEAADPSDETSTEMNTPAGEAETETAAPEEQVPSEEAGTEPAADEEDPSRQPFEAVTETEDVTELSADQAAGPVSDPAEQSQAEPVQITVSDQAVTPDTTSLTAELSRVPSSGILRIVQLEKGETYEQSKLNSYTSLHFSVVAILSAGKNVLALTSKPAVGKQLLVVLRDSSGTGVTDYTSVPITVTAKETERETEAEQKTPEQILANTSVALLKDGAARTENFSQEEKSVDVSVKLDDSVKQCWLKIYGYAGNTSFDPDSNFNKVLWSGVVTDGYTATLPFTESLLPLPVGYKIIACLNVPVGEDFYRPSVSQAFEIVDENGEGFVDYEYPNASIDEKELQEGATSLHISLTGDKRLFQAAREGKTEINVSVAQYPEGDAFDFESSSQIALLRFSSFTEAFSGMEISFPDTPLKAGYRVRAVAYWDQNAEIYLPKGNDYETSFHMPDDSVPVISAPSVSFDGGVKHTDTEVALTISGTIPESCVLLVKQYGADETAFTTQGGTLVGSRFGVSAGKVSLTPQSALGKNAKLVAFLLKDGAVIAQTEPETVTAAADFTVTLENGPVTADVTALTFTATANDSAITTIYMAALCRVDENGAVDPTSPDSYVARLFGQKPGSLTFDGITGLKAGDRLRLVLRYNAGEGEFAGSDITVLAPLAENSVTVTDTEISTDTTEITAVVSGCEEYNGGLLILSTGTAASDGDGDSRTRLGSRRFDEAGTYTFSVDAKDLKAGNTVQAYLYKYDSDNDRTYYKYSESVLIQAGQSVEREAKAEIVTDTVRADRTDVWVKVDFTPTLTGTLKLYTYAGETFDKADATEIYAGAIAPDENSQRATFGSGKLKAGEYLIAVLTLSDGTSVVSNAKAIDPEPEKIKPTVTITSKKVTAGMTRVEASADFDASISQASFKLYQFTGEELDAETDSVISSGSVYYSGRKSIGFYCRGKLTAGAKLQLVMTADGEEARSNIIEVQPSPDWGTPYAAFEVSAVKSNAESIDVTVDYSEEYLSFGDEFYCDVTIYEFSGDYTDQEFEDNEMWEQTTRVSRVGQVNSRRGDATKGTLTIPVRDGVTLNPGDRLIIKLRLPHVEWEGEEVDYLSASVPVIGEEETITAPRVLLYNLSTDTSMGVRLREILDEQGIEAVDVANSQLNETLGYLAGMDGYAANPEAYTGSGSDTEFMVMANFSEAQLDRFLAAMSSRGIRIDHKAVTTAYNVDYEFHRLIDDIREEHETFQALINLNQLVKDAEKLTEAQYGEAERWMEFKNALEEANELLGSEEPSLEDLVSADQKLRAPYLALTGMTELTGEVVIRLTPQEDGTYDMEAVLEGAAEAARLIWKWSSGESGAVLSHVPAEALITKTVTVTGENQYGSKKAQLRVPSKPEAVAKAGTDRIEVAVTQQAEQKNCPAPASYTVTLYQNGTQIASQTLAADDSDTMALTGETAAMGGALQAIFDGLDSETAYTVRIYAESPVGRSDTEVLMATTLETETESESEEETESETAAPVETETETEQETESETAAPVETETETEQETAAPVETETETEKETESETAAPVETETETEQETESETAAPVETETETEQETETQKQTQKTTEVPKTGTTNGRNTPGTGDNTNLLLWLFLLSASGVLLSGEVLRRRLAGNKKQKR